MPVGILIYIEQGIYRRKNMLKRNQVLLNDWLVDFIKYRADKYDISFSESIRVSLCMYFSTMIAAQESEFKPDIDIKKLSDLIEKYENTPQAEEERHKVISKAYFEARKAIEYYMKKESKRVKKEKKKKS
jgi:hypothetical protein